MFRGGKGADGVGKVNKGYREERVRKDLLIDYLLLRTPEKRKWEVLWAR